MSHGRLIEDWHVSDDDLLQYLDEALSEAERGAVASHLAGCSRCVSEFEALGARARRFGEVVSHLDSVQVSPERRAQTWAAVQRAALAHRKQRRMSWVTAPRVAAAVVLLGFGMFGAGPAWAWVATHVERLVRREPAHIVAPVAHAPVATPVVTDRSPQTSTLIFAPSTSEFEIRIPVVVAGDSLEIRYQDVPVASVTTVEYTEVAPLPSGVIIRGLAKSDSTGKSIPTRPQHYVAVMPSSIRQVVLRIGEHVVTRIPSGAAGSSRQFDLRLVQSDGAGK